MAICLRKMLELLYILPFWFENMTEKYTTIGKNC